MANKFLIGLGVLVALLALAAVALIVFVDVNRFKPQIAQAVKERFDRTLSIDGDLTLTVFPRLGVALPKTTLSERGGSAAFASVKSARVSVALLPLLAGRIEADTVSVSGLTATIQRNADGSTSIDDLIGAKAADAPSGAPGDAGAPLAFEVGGVVLSDATLTLRDLATRSTVTLKRLNLTAGRLAPTVRTPVDLSTQFSATQPKVSGELKARGELELDLPRKSFGGKGLDLALKAALDRYAIDMAGKAAELRYDAASGALGIGKLEASGKGTLGSLPLDEAHASVPTLAWHPQARRLSLGGVQATARGRLADTGASAPAQTLEAAFAAPRLEVTEASAAGERVTASVKLGGARQAELKLALDGLSGNAQRLKADRLSIEADLHQPLAPDRVRHVVARLASPMTASVDAQTFALSQLAGEITMEDPALQRGTVKLPVAGTLAVDAKKETVAAQFSTRFDETTLVTAATVRGFAPAKLAFEASADKLDLDRYFPPAKAGPGSAGTAPGADPAVDLSALKGLDIAGEARVGRLQARGIKLQDLRMALRLADGRLALAPLSAALYGGSVRASASAQADGNRMGLDATFTGVSVEPLMKDALGRDILAGRGDVQLALTTAGATVGALKRGLDGRAALTLRDGAVKGIDVAQLLRGARKYLGGGQTQTQTGSAAEKTDFSELTASFAIKDGVARGDDLDLKSALIRLRGAGSVDLAAASLDYTLRATVVGTPKGQDLVDYSVLQGVTVPVTLSGPFEKISYSVDWGAVARDALRANTTGRVRELLNVPRDETQKPPLQRATDKLKDLLGR